MQPTSPQSPIQRSVRKSSSSLGRVLAAWQGFDPLALSLLVLALLAGLLRFWHLGSWSLWVDEAYTFADGRFGLHSDQILNPLGYRMLLAMADALAARPDEFSLRFLPALAGWLCIPLAWWTFRTLVGDRRAALVALLIAVSSWHIFWSQTARFYTLAMATSLLGSGWVLRGWLTGRRALALVGLAVSALAAAFHVTAALLVPALCLGPFLAALCGAPETPAQRHTRRVMLAAALLGGVLALPWLWSALMQHNAQKGTGDWFTGPVHLGLTVGYFFTPLIGAAAMLGAALAWVRRDSAGLVASAVAVIVLVVTFVISTQVQMTAQYVFCLLPWVLLLAVLPLDGWLSGKPGKILFGAGAFVLAAPALASSLLYFTTRGGERPRWRDAYTYIDERREPGDLILGMGSEIGEFYIGSNNPDPRSPRSVSPIGDWQTEGPGRWNRHDRRIWVVIRPQWFQILGEQNEALFRAWLSSDCRLQKSFPVLMEGRDLELRVYLRE